MAGSLVDALDESGHAQEHQSGSQRMWSAIPHVRKPRSSESLWGRSEAYRIFVSEWTSDLSVRGRCNSEIILSWIWKPSHVQLAFLQAIVHIFRNTRSTAHWTKKTRRPHNERPSSSLPSWGLSWRWLKCFKREGSAPSWCWTWLRRMRRTPVDLSLLNWNVKMQLQAAARFTAILESWEKYSRSKSLYFFLISLFTIIQVDNQLCHYSIRSILLESDYNILLMMCQILFCNQNIHGW